MSVNLKVSVDSTNVVDVDINVPDEQKAKLIVYLTAKLSSVLLDDRVISFLTEV